MSDRPINRCEITAIVWSKPKIERLATGVYRCSFNVGVDPISTDPESGTRAAPPMTIQVLGDLADDLADRLYEGCIVRVVGELAMGSDGSTCLRTQRCWLIAHPEHLPDSAPMLDPPF